MYPAYLSFTGKDACDLDGLSNFHLLSAVVKGNIFVFYTSVDLVDYYILDGCCDVDAKI